jgi:hypothetical protein
MAQAAKVETKSEPVAERTAPLIKQKDVFVEWAGHTRKAVTVIAPPGLIMQDLQDAQGHIWKNVQADRTGRALASEDDVRIHAHDRSWTVNATVEYADGTTVQLYDIRKASRQGRDLILWRVDGFEGRWAGDGYGYYRAADGVRMSTATWTTAEAARAACMREQFPSRVAS